MRSNHRTHHLRVFRKTATTSPRLQLERRGEGATERERQRDRERDTERERESKVFAEESRDFGLESQEKTETKTRIWS